MSLFSTFKHTKTNLNFFCETLCQDEYADAKDWACETAIENWAGREE